MTHRLAKADTAKGLSSLQNAANLHVPYAVLLYERYLGRPYASHRDSVSELVGDLMENAIEEQLQSRNITYRKTGRAERIEGFDQAPDFFVPTEFAPTVIIEAKLTNDDGTARDKVTRLIRLFGNERALGPRWWGWGPPESGLTHTNPRRPPVEENPTRICELIVGLGDVEVLGVDDAPGGPVAHPHPGVPAGLWELRRGGVVQGRQRGGVGGSAGVWAPGAPRVAQVALAVPGGEL